MHYSDNQRTLLCEYIVDAFDKLDTVIKEQCKEIAKSAMLLPSSDDEKVADAIVNYVNQEFSDGNITIAEAYKLMPKTVMYIIRQEIIALLKRTRENGTLSEISMSVSCGSSLELNPMPHPDKAVAVTISGGSDSLGIPFRYDVQCPTAADVVKTSDTTWQVILNTTGIHVIQGFAISDNGYKTVKTATVQTTIADVDTGESTGQFVGTEFDSGWTDFIPGCYVSAYTVSLVMSNSHSSNYDSFVILGKKTDNTVVILRDVFKADNRFAVIEGNEKENPAYGKGNLRMTVWKYTNDPYSIDDDIRQIRFLCETPGHPTCASGASVSFGMVYKYDESL